MGIWNMFALIWFKMAVNLTANPNSSVAEIKCLALRILLKDYKTDILVLQIYYMSTALITVLSNGMLLHKLLRKTPKTRPDKLFIVMSCSDIGVGLFTIPVLSLPFSIRNFDILCKLSPAFNFSVYFPYMFSWTMVIIIAVDRMLMITKGHIYGKYVTMNVLYGVITFILLKDLVTSLYIAFGADYMSPIDPFIQYFQIFVEITFILITITVYIYLFYFVRSRSTIMANSRHGGKNFNKRLLLTVSYTFICLLVFTLPQFAGVIIVPFVGTTNDPVFQRNLYYWQLIFIYSNSFANALILLYNNREKKKKLLTFDNSKVTQLQICDRSRDLNTSFTSIPE